MDGSVERGSGRRIGLRNVAGLQPGETIWDTAVIGFGARRRRGTHVSYIVVYRTAEGRQRLITIGFHGSPWTPDSARAEALRLLGEVVRGGDPLSDRRSRRTATSMTMSDLCTRYIADIEAGQLMTRRRQAKKASTVRTDRSRIDAHIIPLIGAKPVVTVSRDDIEGMMQAIIRGTTRKRTKLPKPHALSNTRGGRGAASRTVGLLGGILSYAVRLGVRADNPVHGVVRPADGQRERRLRIEEYASLGDGLVAAGDDADIWAPGLAAIRFMLLTGWRRGEVLGLRWSEVDLTRRTVRLADTKTGPSPRPIAEAACLILR
jgi:integrase